MKKKAITPNVAEHEVRKSKKELGNDIGGSPDEWDYKNLKVLIETYERAYPGRLKKMKADYDIEAALTTRSKTYGEINKDSEFRVAMWMPADLEEVLSSAYPSFWTNKNHMMWFLKRFPIFKMAEKV